MDNYYFYRLAIWFVAHLPLGLVYFGAGVLAELMFLFGIRGRRGIIANQRHALPTDTGWWRRIRTARAAFRHFAYSIVDFFRIPQLSLRRMERLIAEVRGWEHIEPCLSSGRGGIFATVHMGSWELAGAYIARRGVPLTAVALPHKDPRVDRIYVESREANGMEVIPVGGALAKLEDALQRGRFVGLLSDRDTTGKGPLLPFLGETTRMPSGHARLALRTGAWIFPAMVYRLPDWRLVIDIRAPIVPDPEHDTEESLTLRVIEYLETFVTTHPEQWFSFYNLWDLRELPVA